MKNKRWKNLKRKKKKTLHVLVGAPGIYVRNLCHHRHIHVSFISVATSFYIYCKDETLSVCVCVCVCVCVGELNSIDHKLFLFLKPSRIWHVFFVFVFLNPGVITSTPYSVYKNTLHNLKKKKKVSSALKENKKLLRIHFSGTILHSHAAFEKRLIGKDEQPEAAPPPPPPSSSTSSLPHPPVLSLFSSIHPRFLSLSSPLLCCWMVRYRSARRTVPGASLFCLMETGWGGGGGGETIRSGRQSPPLEDPARKDSPRCRESRRSGRDTGEREGRHRR